MLVDTGILVAAADPKDRRSPVAIEILERRGEKIVTDAILSEAHHLIAKRVTWTVATAFLGSIDMDLAVECSVGADRDRARELCRRYLDARLDYTDALTIAVAERLAERTVATLDPAHFRLVRPRHVKAFDVIP